MAHISRALILADLKEAGDELDGRVFRSMVIRERMDVQFQRRPWASASTTVCLTVEAESADYEEANYVSDDYFLCCVFDTLKGRYSLSGWWPVDSDFWTFCDCIARGEAYL